MKPVLVDTNVLLDVLAGNSSWEEWSDREIRRAANQSSLVINPVIYAEVSVGFDSIEALESALSMVYFRRDDLPYEAAFLTGKAFLQYKRNGGTRTSPLPDFFIGAHAAVAGYSLLTRGSGRYRTYFPTLELISPD